MGWNPFKDSWGLGTGGAGGVQTAITTGGLSLIPGVQEGVEGVISDIGEGATDIYHDVSGQTAAEAAGQASATQAGAMMEQLNYLKEINKLPQQLKSEALTKFGKLFGLSGTDQMNIHQQEQIDQAKQSPYYQAMLGGQAAGEEAILRNQAATGGLRSGDTQSALYDYNTQLQNQALAGAYGQQMSGLQGLAGLGTNEGQIGQTMANIGETQAAGILGGAQSQQAGTQNLLNLGLGLGGLFMGKGAI